MTLDKNNRDLVPSPKIELSTRENMLTEKERKWLEKRRTKDAPCGACWRWCRTECKEACDRLTSDYRDAAEFEARVAEKLAEHAGSNARRGEIGTLLRPRGCSWYNADGCRETVCPCGHDIDKCAGIPFCNLYLARIAVELEMEECPMPDIDSGAMNPPLPEDVREAAREAVGEGEESCPKN